MSPARHASDDDMDAATWCRHLVPDRSVYATGVLGGGAGGCWTPRCGGRGRHPGHGHPAGRGDPSGPSADPGSLCGQAWRPRLPPAGQARLRPGRLRRQAGVGIGIGQRRAGRARGGGLRRAGRGGGAAGAGHRPGRGGGPAAGDLQDRPAGRPRPGDLHGRPRGVRKYVHAARRWYSWSSPPSRSRRRTVPGLRSRATCRPAGGSGGRSSSARCGRWVL
jgi:hypothetical protein